MLAVNNNFQDNLPRRRKGRFFFWLLIALIILGTVFLASVAIAYKFYATSKKVITEDPPGSFFESLKEITSQNRKPLRGQQEGRINILLLGLAGENYPGENLTDSIIIASIDPKTYQTAMLSVPRDFYVQIPDTSSYTKINALFARGKDKHGNTTEGIEDLKQALSEITGLDIHYYVAIDFDGFKKIIDELGGVKIQVLRDIHDERYPGPSYSYETFNIQKGLWIFDGETALKYARTRHDEDGDFGRSFRQQQILESARQKAFSVGILVNVPAINNILNILGDHLRTNIPLDELESFLDLSEKIDTHTTINKVLDTGKTDSLLAVSHVYLGGVRAFILIPRVGSYDEIRNIAENIFDLELIERKKKEIENEKASVAIVNRSGVANFDKKIAALLEKMGYEIKIAKLVEVKPLQNQSVIYDLTNGLKPFSLEDLSKKLGAKIAADSPFEVSPRETRGETSNNSSDFYIITGSDLTENLNYDENTIEELEQGYDRQEVDERQYIELLKKGSNKKF